MVKARLAEFVWVKCQAERPIDTVTADVVSEQGRESYKNLPT